MYGYVYDCMCIYIYIYTVYIYIHLHVYLHTYACICICMYMYIHIHTCRCDQQHSVGSRLQQTRIVVCVWDSAKPHGLPHPKRTTLSGAFFRERHAVYCDISPSDIQHAVPVWFLSGQFLKPLFLAKEPFLCARFDSYCSSFGLSWK